MRGSWVPPYWYLKGLILKRQHISPNVATFKKPAAIPPGRLEPPRQTAPLCCQTYAKAGWTDLIGLSDGPLEWNGSTSANASLIKRTSILAVAQPESERA